MTPIGNEVINYYHTNCSVKIANAKRNSKNYNKILSVQNTDIYLNILTKMNHVIKTINDAYGQNNPNN